MIMSDPQSGVALESRTSSPVSPDAHTRLRRSEATEILEILLSALCAGLKCNEFPMPIRLRGSLRSERHEVLAYLLDEEACRAARPRYVRLDQLQGVLPWGAQTIRNMRCKHDLNSAKELAWATPCPVSKRYLADLDLLFSLLLAQGRQEVAVDVAMRARQVQIHGNVFRGRKLGCSYAVPGCKGGRCERCEEARSSLRRSLRSM